MADKIVLSDVKSGFNIAVVNDNFSKIEKVVNDNLLWRDQRGISGDNALQSNIDVNSKRLYNLPAPISDFEAARKKDVDDALGGNSGMLGEMQELLDQAEQAVIDASNASRLTAGTATEGPLSVSIVGPAGSQVLNLTIPAGSGGSGSPGPFLRLDKTTSQDEVIGPSVNAIGINTVIAPGDTVTVDPTSELIIIGQPVDTPNIGLEIHAATSKATPADADELGITDSAASWGLKKLTFTNLKAWIGGLFVSKSGDTMTGQLISKKSFANGASSSNFVAEAEGTAQGQAAGYSFRPTFTGTADSVPRRAADIWASYSGVWATEKLSFGVGTGSTNDGFNRTIERLAITGTGNVLVTGGGLLGYGVGSGGTATQSTNKATGVPINKPTGVITMNNAALAAGDSVEFQLQSTLINENSLIVLHIINNSVANATSYRLKVICTYPGGAFLRLSNISSGSLSESVQFQFNIFQGAAS